MCLCRRTLQMGTKLEPVNELNHYYGGTVVSVLRNGIKWPFSTSNFLYGNYNTYIQCTGSISRRTGENFLTWVPGIVNAEDIDYEYPDLGYFNISGCAYYVSRSPERQFKKGIVPAYIKFTRKAKLLDKLEEDYAVNINGIASTEKYYSLFNPKYYTVDELINKINNVEVYSGAFCSKYAIEPAIYNDKLVVLYKHLAVGYVDRNVIVLTAEYEHLVESLSEYYQVEIK